MIIKLSEPYLPEGAEITYDASLENAKSLATNLKAAIDFVRGEEVVTHSSVEQLVISKMADIETRIAEMLPAAAKLDFANKRGPGGPRQA